MEADDTDDRATVMLVRKIIEDAHRQNASDIHIEPYGFKEDAQVRFRIDGRCEKVLTIPKNHIRAVVSRLKILAKLDIAERRQPQDGKIRFQTSEGRNIEIRVSTIPTVDGNEDIVLRLLANNEPLPLNKIMAQHVYKPFTQLIRRPYGLVLVVGPTGSGKTTTLHSALSIINTPEKKIWTAEDPVEITQFRLRQVQVNPKIGLTFAAAMRAFLRADPDVIMVGEMRDQETVKIAIEASLTGHLVFSTLHTNSAPETITRLIDMGMDPFNFADALLGIVSQRLVRTLCDKCKKPYHPPTLAYDHLKKLYGPTFDKAVNIPYTDDLQFYQAVGCEACNNSGYKGRMGLFELLVNSRSLKKSIIERSGVAKIRKLAIREGMTTLMQEGIQSIFMGHTDPKQVIPVCSSHV
jgi:type II secretory ATPase GspE/PulE/Tfp pilus assembly ATPase PilB-like protein